MPFEARVSRIKVLGLLLICVVSVIGGLLIGGVFGDGSDTLITRISGWLIVGVSGLLVAIGVTRLIRGGLVLRIDADGVYWRRWSEQVIPWSAIREIKVRELRGQQFLDVNLYDPAAYPPKFLIRWVRRLNTARAFGDLSLNVFDSDRSFADLLAAFDRFAPAELRPQVR